MRVSRLFGSIFFCIFFLPSCSAEKTPTTLAPTVESDAISNESETAPTPRPSATPDNRPVIFGEFESYGISLHVSDLGNADPMALQRFMALLDRNKKHFFSRASALKEIEPASRTRYDSRTKKLEIGIDLSDATLASFFSFFDRKVSLEIQTGIIFDFDETVFGTDYAKMKASLEFFEKQDYRAVQNMVQRIQLESFNYYSVDTKSLSLQYSTYQKDFTAFTRINTSLFSALLPYHQKQLPLEFGKSFDFFQDVSALQKLANDLSLSQEGLFHAHDRGLLAKVRISKGNGDHHYLPRQKILDLFTGNSLPISEAVSSFSLVYGIADRLKAKLLIRNELDRDFLVFASLLRANQDIILSRSQLKQIGYANQSRYEKGILYVGLEDTPADLLLVLQSIP